MTEFNYFLFHFRLCKGLRLNEAKQIGSLKTEKPVFRLPLRLSLRHLAHQPRAQYHRAHAATQMQQ